MAIAVPLFVGALDDAKEKTFEANKRAVVGTAVSTILGAKSTDAWNVSKIFADGKDVAQVTATVKDGKITITKIDGAKSSEASTTFTETTYETFVESTGEIKVTIPKTELTVTGE